MASPHVDPAFSTFIPDAVFLQSQTNPTHPLFVYAKPDPSEEIVSITSLEFARATHRAAQVLRPNREGQDGQVVAIIALADTLLYQALIVGLMTANLVPFPISPRNSPTAVVSLLRKSSCHRILATCATLKPLFAGVQQELVQTEPNFSLKIEELPSLAQIYPNLGSETADCAFEPYMAQSAPPSLDDLCIYLHSSGSTGLPKPIAHSHRTLMQWASTGPVEEIRDAYPHPVAAMPLPSFHLIGIYGLLLKPVYGGITIALYPPTALTPEALPIFPSPDNILAHTRKTHSKVMFTLPALLALWSNSPEAIAFLKTLAFIAFGGGCLPRRLGDALVRAGLKIQTVYGATEFGTISSMLPYPEDKHEWEWFRFSDKVNVRWMPQGDGTFECQVLHSENYTLSVNNLSDVKGYATSDLFVQHPEKKHLWKIVGRTDDVIVHLSGENTVPAPMEDIIMSSPLVAAAIIFGRDQNQTGILIEPVPGVQIDVEDAVQVTDLRNKLWTVIEEANSAAPKFSRIFPEMVIFTPSTKPLPRAGKGTVMRKAALAAYATEIEALYEAIEKPGLIESLNAPTVWDSTGIQQWLLNLATDLSQGAVISPDGDLFEHGFDSLSAAFLQLRVVGAMRSSKNPSVQNAASGVTQNAVYSYRTISELASFLASIVAGTTQAVVDSKKVIDEMILKYTSPPAPSTSLPSTTTTPATVLLTGSTGSLGSQILASLIKDSRVTNIYAFNRPSAERSLAERHQAIFTDRKLDIALLGSPKLVFVEGEINQPCFGLAPDVYDTLRNSVTLIIHNAWTLDFNLPLASFEHHISATHKLIDFVRSCAGRPTFIFTSSITSVMSDAADGPATDASLIASSATGYGQSKFVAEQILAKSGLHVACLRIGQICGTLPKGAWAISDWFPILVKTSITLGRLPEANGLVSWIDFETVAQAVLDVSFDPSAETKGLFAILNLVHPRPVDWNFVLASARDIISSKIIGGSTKPLQLVKFSDWLAELEAFATRRNSAIDYEKLPGIRLLDFFSKLSAASSGSLESEFGGFNLATDEIQAVSPAVKSVGKITSENVEAWLGYWRSTGFI
ncbi:putative aminoadipate reductase, partial [Mycena latifolia]